MKFKNVTIRISDPVEMDYGVIREAKVVFHTLDDRELYTHLPVPTDDDGNIELSPDHPEDLMELARALHRALARQYKSGLTAVLTKVTKEKPK